MNTFFCKDHGATNPPFRSIRSDDVVAWKIPASKYRTDRPDRATAAGVSAAAGDAGVAGDAASTDASRMLVSSILRAFFRRAALGLAGSAPSLTPVAAI